MKGKCMLPQKVLNLQQKKKAVQSIAVKYPISRVNGCQPSSEDSDTTDKVLYSSDSKIQYDTESDSRKVTM